MASRKQRLIFLEMDRNDPYSVMDIAKIADIVVVSLSCKKTNVNGIKQDPFEHAKAIDELGYRALSLIRSQGMPSLIGVLQHLEFVSSSKHSYVKKLFQRIFESEFTDKYKFMPLNKSSEVLQNTDSNALLRQIAVQFPDDITWRQKRSYLLGEVSHIRSDEVHIRGYVKQNFLNAKRLIHITGQDKIAWKIKRIEVATDPCPVKLSNKEKEKVMQTSRA
jgi:pre-rRNA-processing protein TSR1